MHIAVIHLEPKDNFTITTTEGHKVDVWLERGILSFSNEQRTEEGYVSPPDAQVFALLPDPLTGWHVHDGLSREEVWVPVTPSVPFLAEAARRAAP